MYQFDERFVIHGLAATQSLEYVQDNLFHAPHCKGKGAGADLGFGAFIKQRVYIFA